MAMGAGRSSAAQHSQSLQAIFAHIPGLKVVIPSTPRDAKGLLKSAIRDDNPVLFFEDKLMYNDKGPVPTEDDFLIPLGQADIKRSGSDVTLVATSSMVTVALEAAERLAADGLSAEVIDPRTLMPLDEETILESVRKTGYAIVIDEGVQSYGATAEIAARIGEKAFDHLDAPVLRIGAADLPVPFSPALELPTIPDVDRVVDTVKKQRSHNV
jgi:pyruvate dehydrogenase E1 component beta subunit